MAARIAARHVGATVRRAAPAALSRVAAATSRAPPRSATVAVSTSWSRPLARTISSGGGASDTVLKNVEGRVMVLNINRPKALNALNSQVVQELLSHIGDADRDPTIGCVVITGGDKAFAAGADIKEMAGKTLADWRSMDLDTTLLGMSSLAKVTKPVIAAVKGFALGGGCELAMMCDIILAGESAKFGQPEINLGIIPGAGGTQRLTQAVGKSKAMQLCLTGDPIDAATAERAGLVSEVVPDDELHDRALKVAKKIAAQSMPVVAITKDAVNRSFEMGLSEGVNYERQQFLGLFATEDQKEGMAAFAEKRKPEWKHR